MMSDLDSGTPDANDQVWHLEAIVDELRAEVERLKAALGKINAIRNSIVAFQTVNWSEHICPIVAALNEAGIRGMPYSEAKAAYLPLLERAAVAETERDELRGILKESVQDSGGVLKMHWLAKARAALGET